MLTHAGTTSDSASPLGPGTGWMRDATVIGAGRVLSGLAMLTTFVLIARRLGPDAWSRFATAFGAIQAAGFVADLGLANWTLRESARRLYGLQPTPPGTVARTVAEPAARIAAWCGVALFVSALSLTTLMPVPVDGGCVLWLSFAAALRLPVTIWEAALRSGRKLLPVGAAGLIDRMTSLALIVALPSDVLDPTWAAVAIAAGAGSNAGWTWLAYSTWRGTRPASPLAITIPRARQVLRTSASFWLIACLLAALPRLDVVLVFSTSRESVSAFAIGDRVVGALQLVPAAASAVLYPYAVQGGLRGRPMGARRVLFLAGAAAVVPLAVGVAAFYGLALGREYADGRVCVLVMLLALPFTFGASAGLVSAFAAGRERAVLVRLFLASVVSSIALPAMAYCVGSVGAAIAYVCRQAVFDGILARAATPALGGARSSRDLLSSSESSKAARDNGNGA